MPILSTKLLAVANGELRYQSDGGQIVNIERNEKTHFISASGVYFQKMFIPKTFLCKPHKEEETTHGSTASLLRSGKGYPNDHQAREATDAADQFFGRQG